MNQPPKQWEAGTGIAISTLGTAGKRRLRKWLSDTQGGRCFYCTRLFSDQPHRRCTIDHVIPLCEGGADDDTNVVGACHQCNRAKGCLTLSDLENMVATIRLFPIPTVDGERADQSKE